MKSSYSQGNGACVDVVAVDGGVEVSDTKDPGGPVLHFTNAEFLAFLRGAKAGEFDHVTEKVATSQS